MRPMQRPLIVLSAAACWMAGLGATPAPEVLTRTVNNGNLVLEDVPEIRDAVAEDLRRYKNVRSAAVLDWSRDGQSLYISTRFGEVNQLAYRAWNDPAPRLLTADIPWNVDGAALSDDRRRMAFTVNEDGWNTLYLLDTRSLRFRKVEGLPKGLVGSMRFSPDGRRLALTLNTARTPSDAHVLELGRGALRYGELVRWTESEVGGLDTARFVEPELIRYPTLDGRDIPAFVYQPEGKGPWPVLVYIHGGPEGQYRPGFSGTFQMWVSKLGVAVVAPNVRGSNGYGRDYVNLDNGYQREDSVKDIGALLDWIATRPDLDASRVAVYGGSYGGYMVLACATHYSARLRAAIDLVGISNFVTFLENTQPYRQDLRRVEYGDERDPRMRAFLERISPNNHVQKITIPMLVVQGQNDPRVPVTESEQIVKALRAGGKAVWYMNALNEGHGYRKKENRDVMDQAVVMFLRNHLLNAPASAGP